MDVLGGKRHPPLPAAVIYRKDFPAANGTVDVPYPYLGFSKP
jgi:hypothetical protein